MAGEAILIMLSFVGGRVNGVHLEDRVEESYDSFEAAGLKKYSIVASDSTLGGGIFPEANASRCVDIALREDY